jgi:hypothetical protein
MGRTQMRRATLRVATQFAAAMAGALVSNASPAATTEGYDFKGLTLGAPTTAAQVEERLNTACVHVGGGVCDEFEASMNPQGHIHCGPGLEGVTVCNGLTTIVGAPGRVNVVISADGHLQRVMVSEFDSERFDSVFAELQRKFGRPKTISRSILQNGFGARYQQVQATWTDSQHCQVTAWKYSGTANESSLYFGTQQDQQLMNRVEQGVKGDL